MRIVCTAWCGRPRNGRDLPAIGWRLTAAMPSGWPGCCGADRRAARGASAFEGRGGRARSGWRARRGCPGDLMRARHWLSERCCCARPVWKAGAWTGAREAFLRSQRFYRIGVQLGLEEPFDAVLSGHTRRDRLDAANEQIAANGPFAPVV